MQLEQAASALLPLYPLIKHTLTPTLWDSPPLACNLRDACLGFPSHPHFDISGVPGFVRIKGTTNLGKFPVQKRIYDELVAIKYHNSIESTCQRRLTSLFEPFTLDFINLLDLSASLRSLKGEKVGVVMKVLKSWCNGWATSCRYHEVIRLPCLLGCGECKDTLNHYLQCPHLYALWKFMIPEAHEDPLIRWGIIHPCTSSFKQVACVHAGYHAVRRYCKECLPQTCFIKTQLDGPTLRSSWACFADAFTVEASELGLITRKFSLTGFLDFLVNRQSHDFLGAFECGRSATPQELIRL